MGSKDVKAAQIAELADRLGRCSIAIVTDYRGLTVSELADLRRRLRGANVEYRVAKNTLTRFAAERAGQDAITAFLEGPTAIAFGLGDPVEAAKALEDYARTARVFAIKGGVLGGRRLDRKELQSLAELPGKPQLQARLVGTIQGPMASLVGTLNGLLSQIVYILEQRTQQLGGEVAGAEAAA